MPSGTSLPGRSDPRRPRCELRRIGNYGAQLHGAEVQTEDADVAYQRTEENHRRLAAALGEMDAHIRRTDDFMIPLPTDQPGIFEERESVLGVSETRVGQWAAAGIRGECPLLEPLRALSSEWFTTIPSAMVVALRGSGSG